MIRFLFDSFSFNKYTVAAFILFTAEMRVARLFPVGAAYEKLSRVPATDCIVLGGICTDAVKRALTYYPITASHIHIWSIVYSTITVSCI